MEIVRVMRSLQLLSDCSCDSSLACRTPECSMRRAGPIGSGAPWICYSETARSGHTWNSRWPFSSALAATSPEATRST